MDNRTTRVIAALLLSAVALTACSESETASNNADGNGSTTTAPNVGGAVKAKKGDGSVVSKFAGADWLLGTVPSAATAANKEGEPLRVGFIGTDSGPIAAMPELHQAIDASVAFINAELGGLKGRPIELVPCEADATPEKSIACARKMIAEKVVAVLGGLDIVAGSAVKILEENGIAWVGGIPLDQGEMESTYAFQFSGGSAGAFTAFADHAAHTLKAKNVSVVYMELPQVSTAAKEYGVNLLEKFGVHVTAVPFDFGTQDYAAVVQKADESNPDAIIVGAADFACPKAMQAIVDLNIDATIYMVGSCADPKWLEQVGIEKLQGVIFNIENRLTQTASTSADTEVYTAVIEKYGNGVNARGAATVSFRSMMNLYAVMAEIDGDITPEAIVKAFRAAEDHPSFDGHPFTCDGKQIPGLRSLCAPQQVLARLDGPHADSLVEASDGWVDVPAILAAK
jgi:branched-chain amino acid transport system substrate-binding protein